MEPRARLRKTTLAVNDDGAAPITLIPDEQNYKKTLLWNDLPQWYQDNEYICTGYRAPSYSHIKSFLSLFWIHNQTGNIYSHLAATLEMLILGLLFHYNAHKYYDDLEQAECIVFALFFLGGVVCFSLSTLYHALNNHSEATAEFYIRLDLFGITCVTAGCFPPGLWYTFPCVSSEVKMRLIMFNLAAQILAALFIFFCKQFRTPTWRPARGVLFSFMASSAFYPIISAIYLHGYKKMNTQAGASWYILTIAIYLLSVLIYATRWPEALHPGRYDIWGHSHQIFHVGMALGLTCHLGAFLKAFHYYHTTGGMCVEVGW